MPTKIEEDQTRTVRPVMVEEPVVPLERNMYGSSFGRTCGKGNLRKSYCNTVGRKFPIGMLVRTP